MLIKVRVFPGSKEEGVTRIADDALEIKVKEKPELGLANDRVRQLLAIYMGVMESKVRMVKGAQESHKIFEIRE